MSSATENFDSHSPGAPVVVVRRLKPIRRPNTIQRGRSWGFLIRIMVAAALIGAAMFFYRLPGLITAFGLHLVPVSGKVLIEDDASLDFGQTSVGQIGVGQIEGTRLLFVPLERDFADQRQPVSIADVSADGRFELRTLAGQTGAVRGRHLVFILPGDSRKAPDATQANDKDRTESETDTLDEVAESERRYREFLNPIHWLLRRPPMAIRNEIHIPYLGTRYLEIKAGRQTNGAS